MSFGKKSLARTSDPGGAPMTVSAGLRTNPWTIIPVGAQVVYLDKFSHLWHRAVVLKSRGYYMRIRRESDGREFATDRYSVRQWREETK